LGFTELFILELCNEKFLKGKKIWGYVSGNYVIPKNTEEGDDVLIVHRKQTLQRSLLGSIILLSIP